MAGPCSEKYVRLARAFLWEYKLERAGVGQSWPELAFPACIPTGRKSLPHLPALHAVASEAHLPAVLREHADVVGVEIAAGDIYVVGLVETTRHKI